MKRYLLAIKHIIIIIYVSIKDGISFIILTELPRCTVDKIKRLQFELTVGVHSLEKGLSYQQKKGIWRS